MSDEKKAVFSAFYADWKVLKTRSAVAVVFEIPIEAADYAYRVLGGMPNFGSPQRFAIARLDPEKVKA